MAALARVVEHVERIWRGPDDGIWEARGPRHHYTHSKVMAWIVFDRAVRLAERYGLERQWSAGNRPAPRSTEEVCEQGYDPREAHVHPVLRLARSSTRAFCSSRSWGFCRGTTSGSPVRSTRSSAGWGETASSPATPLPRPTMGCPGDEGQFLACSFWLVDALALNGRVEEARALFERLLGLANDLGLLAEEYDVERQRQVGQLPPGVQPPHADRRAGRDRDSRGQERLPLEQPEGAATGESSCGAGARGATARSCGGSSCRSLLPSSSAASRART